MEAALNNNLTLSTYSSFLNDYCLTQVESKDFCSRYYDPSTGRFLQQDPDPGKLASPNTFLSKYIYGVNNPVMFSDPSGRFIQVIIGAIIGAAVGAVIGAIDAFENGGNFLEKVLRGAIGGALYGAAIAINPTAGLFSLGVTLTKAGSRKENFFAALNNSLIADGAFAVVGSIAINTIDSIDMFNWLQKSDQINSFLKAAEYFSYGLLLNTYMGTRINGCDDKKGAWYGSDFCRL